MTTTDNLNHPRIVPPAEWIAARQKLLAREKELTRARDQLNADRRALPWTKVDKPYVFDAPGGPRRLADLFEGRSQLIVHHFMFGPGWEEGCVGCSFTADHIEGSLVHLEHHDVSLVRISRAPLDELELYRQRMGWRVPWLSSAGTDFNFDYGVSFRPEEIATGKVYYNYAVRDVFSEEVSGFSVFYQNQTGDVFHTYSTYSRGDELVDTTYMLLDLTPKGRNENGPHFNLMDWVRRHDDYDNGRSIPATDLPGADMGGGV